MGAFNIIFCICVLLLSAGLAFFVYVKSGQTIDSLFWAAYAFGGVFFAGLFTAFPGGSKRKNEWGEMVKVGNINNLSKTQSFIIFAWIVGVGLALVYVTQFTNVL